MPNCCVPLCKKTKKLDPTLKFHRFPVDEKRCNKWIKLIRAKNFEWTMNKVICSWHFPNGRLPDSDPTRFQWNQHKNFSLNGLALENSRRRKRNGKMDTSKINVKEEPGLEFNCFFCGKEKLRINSSFIFEEWMSQCANSICEELNLDLSSSHSLFASASFCANCYEMYSDINALKGSIHHLQLKLSETLAKVKGMLLDNFAKVIREDTSRKSTTGSATSRAIKCIGIQLQSVKLEQPEIESLENGYGGEPRENLNSERNREDSELLVPKGTEYKTGLDWLLSKEPNEVVTTPEAVNIGASQNTQMDSSEGAGENVSARFSTAAQLHQKKCAKFQKVPLDHSYSLAPPRITSKRPWERRLSAGIVFQSVGEELRKPVTTAKSIQPSQSRQIFNIKQNQMGFSLVPVEEPKLLASCNTCGLNFQCLDEINLHLQLHIPKHNLVQPLREEHMKLKSEPSSKTQKRIATQDSKPPLPIPCPTCNLLFDTPVEMRIHKTTEHPPIFIPPICEYCGIQLKSNYSFNRHIARHKKEFQCNEGNNCGKAFGTNMDLKLHILSCHKLDVPPLRSCTICKKGFHTIPTFQRHMEYHGNERKYKCNLCSQGFKSNSNLWVHVNINHKRNPNGLNSKRSRPRKGRLPTGAPPPPPSRPPPAE